MRFGWLVALTASMALVVGGVLGAVSTRRELRTERDERLGALSALSVGSVDGQLRRIVAVLDAGPGDAAPAALAAVLGDGVNVCVTRGDVRSCAMPEPVAPAGLVDRALAASQRTARPAVAAGGGDVTDGVVVVAVAVVDDGEPGALVVHVPARQLLSVDISALPATSLGVPRLVDAAVAGDEDGPTTRGGRRIFVLPTASVFVGGEYFVVASVDDDVAISSGQRLLFTLFVTAGAAGLLASLTVLVAHQRRLSRRATTDDLTGLATRREFVRRADVALAAARAHDGSVAVVFVDLDGFKAVNDRAGHHAGDDVLAEVARRLSASVREGDVVARWGGDEFAVLLPDAVLAVATARAADLAAVVATVADPTGDGLSATAGVAVFPDHAEDTHQLVGAADTAMYDARRAGRRCGVSAGSPDGR